MSHKKYKKGFEKDWNFYLLNKDKFNFHGGRVPQIISDFEIGKSAKEVFFRYDSEGKMLPCREPQLLLEIFACKVSINMHLNIWADGYTDVMIPVEELLQEFIGVVPGWVEVSLRNQIRKKLAVESKR